MTILFKNVKLKNFLSYKDAEFDLRDQGYCLIKGQNNCSLDSALSNGSGKSSWVSAICWCLTGQTLQGIRGNVANIYIPENECWVELNFKADEKNFKLTRFYKPRSDLKIIINGEDKSGKGLKESEEQLSILLPDLTRELIASTVLLGQGLPDKLSSLTPSRRKELLEKLSKSDFMIQDIKRRLEERQNRLDNKQRASEDNLLKLSTEVRMYSLQSEESKKQLDILLNTNYDEEIKDLNNKVVALQAEISKNNLLIKEKEDRIIKLNEDYINLNKNKQISLESINESYIANSDNQNKNYNKSVNDLNQITVKINQLTQEITRLKNIKDVCPTCNQKLPNVLKPDTSTLEKEREGLHQQRKEAEEEHQKQTTLLSSLKENRDNEILKVNNYFKGDISRLEVSMTDLKRAVTSLKVTLNTLLSSTQLLENNYNKALLSKQQLLENIERIKSKIQETENKTKLNKENIAKEEINKQDILDHQAVLKKISTLVKRDFRGYLLTNVIEYIDRKAKEYSQDVFENSSVDFKLEGNNIEIYFNGKCSECLSGGERQKVDLIIQFAVRDMLETCLDYRSNILVLDEITDALDSIGVDKIFNLIFNKLTDVESIFIISHHASSLSIPADREILIVKNEQGISNKQ